MASSFQGTSIFIDSAVLGLGLDPMRNDAPLDFNSTNNASIKHKLGISDEGQTVSSSGDSSRSIDPQKDRLMFDRGRPDYRKTRENNNRNDPPEVTIIGTSNIFAAPASLITPGISLPPPMPGTIMQPTTTLEQAGWQLNPGSAALAPGGLNPTPTTLPPTFTVMGMGDPNLLTFGMNGFGQFGFMRNPDPAVLAATAPPILGPVKDVIHLSSCILFPPKPNQPPPTTRDRPPGCRTVFVGGLPEKCSEEVIREIFLRCGEITTIRMSKKNFCHIRFEIETFVDSAIYLSGYSLKIGDSEDSRNTGRYLHVDYAQARDDQYEWECRERAIQREMRHRERMEQERLRPPSPPPVVHYTDHEAALLTEKLKGEESFQKAAQVLITWLDRGELSKKNAGQFYSMIQSSNSHVRRLTNEKAQFEEELSKARQLLRQRMQGIFIQFHQIEKVFLASSHQKVWDHFTKAQRKTIDMWRKQAEEIKNAQLEDVLNEREEDEMELSDDDQPEDGSSLPKKQKSDYDLNNMKANREEESRLREENDIFRCQLEAYRNEVGVLRSEAQQEKETSERQVKLLQQALQGMQQQLMTITKQRSVDEEEIVQLRSQLTTGHTETDEISEGTQTLISPSNTPPQEKPSTSTGSEITSSSMCKVHITEKEAKLIGLISTFLHVHPLGAGVDYIWSYLQQMDGAIQPRDVESLLTRFPSIFKQELSGIGALLERKWTFGGFSIQG